MKLPDFKGLTFEEQDHLYHLEGIPIPSVTTIMQPLSQDYYGKINEEKLAFAAIRGTRVHQAVEEFELFGVMDIPDEFSGYTDAYLQWKNDFKVEILATEQKVYHKKLRYAGTVDLICRINGKIILMDLKTTSTTIPHLLGVQLVAYKNALLSHDIDFVLDEIMALGLKKDGKYKVVHSCELPSERECWNCFSALQISRNYIKNYK